MPLCSDVMETSFSGKPGGDAGSNGAGRSSDGLGGGVTPLSGIFSWVVGDASGDGEGPRSMVL